MNIPILIAATLSGLAFLLHTFEGDREVKMFKPAGVQNDGYKMVEIWTMIRCGWHLISFDLLATSTLLFLILFTNIIIHEPFLLTLLGIYYIGYGTVFLITIAISKPFPWNYLRLWQWIFFYTIGGLIFWGIHLM
ncbi:hypothetical protein [Desmospora profundinema]|uniref:Uncharacterized protein n=1 Tax=Desmospora profundinema TaxID=1571184 RepID=A0ABU1IN82_9BACL|nr:hypothetical protein [Desmospora profundinema]MDR6226250.1 hypothetical protein [Desmospora profundinema]